jgi:Xaa-Pro aminopeptidase
MDTHDVSGAPTPDFAARRSEAFERLGDGALVLPAAPLQYASRDTERPYVPDRELFYVTGLTEPGTIAVLVGGEEPRLVVFARDRDPDAELWAGPRSGPEAAGERAGADEARSLEDLPARLPELLAGADRVHYRLGAGGEEVERLVRAALARARARGPRTGSGPRGIVDPGETLDDLRVVKDAAELEAIRRACDVTIRGHRAGAGRIEPGVGEWAIEASIDGAFRSSGATRPGFDTIVGSGENACVLHYVHNRERVPEGGLVLVDAGAEVDLYHGDVTRTYPASGRFSPRQRDVYDLVEAALRAGIEAVRPGETIGDVHAAATRVLVEGLVELGVLSGEVDGLLEQDAHKPFFPHQTSHWLGLDVHDPGDYARAGASRVLEPGMVFTVEPGLYFRPGVADEQAAGFAGIGVRIEDDVAVTADGRENLTAGLPTAAGDVEELVGAGA